MRILVTGGLGFLGHAIIPKLIERGHTPIALSSQPGSKGSLENVDISYANVLDLNHITKVIHQIQPEGIIHLAALTQVRDSFESPLDYFEVNAVGTNNLLRAIEKLPPIPVVFASTAAVYGPCKGHIEENHPTLPTNPYGASKLAAENLLLACANTGAIGLTIIRCFNISGAVGDITESTQSSIISRALLVAAKKASYLPLNGDGSVVREFTHVKDIAAAMCLALDKIQIGKTNIYNIGSGTQCSMLNVIKQVEKITDQTVPIEFRPPRQEPKILVADSTSIRRDLQWTPKYPQLDKIIEDAWKANRV